MWDGCEDGDWSGMENRALGTRIGLLLGTRRITIAAQASPFPREKTKSLFHLGESYLLFLLLEVISREQVQGNELKNGCQGKPNF